MARQERLKSVEDRMQDGYAIAKARRDEERQRKTTARVMVSILTTVTRSFNRGLQDLPYMRIGSEDKAALQNLDDQVQKLIKKYRG